MNNTVILNDIKGEYETFSEEETFALAEKIAKEAEPGSIFTLDGELGVGKTIFTKGFAKGLLVDDVVSSPTFTIVQVYDSGRLPLYHFDVYRIGDVSEMDEIGYEDYFYGDGISIIEWADIIQDIIPENAVRVRILKDLSKGTDYRKIIIK